MDLLIYMHFSSMQIIVLITVALCIFLLVPLCLLFYSKAHNAIKVKYREEKHKMQLEFDEEILEKQIEVQEQTLQNIAADLHDNIGQLLSLTASTLSSIKLNETEKSQSKINNSLSLLHKSIKELRDLSKLLQGEQLVEAGLGKAIKLELDRLRTICNYTLKVKNQLLEAEVSSPNKDLIILRLLQEIIINIIKHARATHVYIGAFLLHDMLYLHIAENGVGFNYNKIKLEQRGFGLNLIHKRIVNIDGNIQIASNALKGTKIIIEIPYP